MKQLRTLFRTYRQNIYLILVILSSIGGLLFYRLGSLTKGLSEIEMVRAIDLENGWYGIYQNPFYLPIKFISSLIDSAGGHQNLTLIRLPNVIIGVIVIFSFSLLMKIWHGNRTALFGTILFATSAWVLHITRIASNDVLYLAIIPLLLLSMASIQRYPERSSLYFVTVLSLGILVYIPGAIWLVLLAIFWLRKYFKHFWKQIKSIWIKILLVLAGISWFPLLSIRLNSADNLKLWLGLPEQIAGPITMFKNLFDVLTDIFIKVDLNPGFWLDQTPLIDVFTLSMFILGIYFYAKHWRVGRSKIILSFFILGSVLISLGGPVSLSLVVPIIYICAATGVAFLIHEWLQVFPINPFARAVGIGLVAVVISLSTFYNLRVYFIAWPHNIETKKTFKYYP